MARFWDEVKSYIKAYLVLCAGLWLITWIFGSWQAGHVLSPMELLATPDKWVAALSAKGRP